MKIIILDFIIADNDRESTIYDCEDRSIDNKLKNIVIKNILACYSDYCNNEVDWKNNSLKNMVPEINLENSYYLPSYVFWGILGLSFLIILCIQFVRSAYGFDKESTERLISRKRNRTYMSNICSERC